MDVFIYGESNSVEWEVEDFPGISIHFVDSSEKLLAALKEGGGKLVFLDFDYNTQEAAKLDQEIASTTEAIRVVFAADAKILKKYQKSKNAAHGYMQKPLTKEVVEELVRDFFPDEVGGGVEKMVEREVSYDTTESISSIIKIPESATESLLGELTDDIEPAMVGEARAQEGEPDDEVREDALEDEHTVILDEATGELKLDAVENSSEADEKGGSDVKIAIDDTTGEIRASTKDDLLKSEGTEPGEDEISLDGDMGEVAAPAATATATATTADEAEEDDLDLELGEDEISLGGDRGEAPAPAATATATATTADEAEEDDLDLELGEDEISLGGDRGEAPAPAATATATATTADEAEEDDLDLELGEDEISLGGDREEAQAALANKPEEDSLGFKVLEPSKDTEEKNKDKIVTDEITGEHLAKVVEDDEAEGEETAAAAAEPVEETAAAAAEPVEETAAAAAEPVEETAAAAAEFSGEEISLDDEDGVEETAAAAAEEDSSKDEISLDDEDGVEETAAAAGVESESKDKIIVDEVTGAIRSSTGEHLAKVVEEDNEINLEDEAEETAAAAEPVEETAAAAGPGGDEIGLEDEAEETAAAAGPGGDEIGLEDEAEETAAAAELVEETAAVAIAERSDTGERTVAELLSTDSIVADAEKGEETEDLSAVPPEIGEEETATVNMDKVESESQDVPSLDASQSLHYQGLIRELREEREQLLREIRDLKTASQVFERDYLGIKAELEDAKIGLSIAHKRHSDEIEELKYQKSLAEDKNLFAQEKMRKLQKEFGQLENKIRFDFSHVKERERELQSRLEIMEMDSEAQLTSRDKKILELKKKIDQLEFNMENAAMREKKFQDDKSKVEEKMNRIMKNLRCSIELFDEESIEGKGAVSRKKAG